MTVCFQAVRLMHKTADARCRFEADGKETWNFQDKNNFFKSSCSIAAGSSSILRSFLCG
jgi:hypothetical protein